MTQERLESIRKELDISLIKLNPENPRLGAVLGMNYNGENSLTQEQISSSLQMMSQGESNSDLNQIKDSYKATKASIIKMGRISTPIIVQKLEKKDNNFEYIVLEGNNRLTIYKELHKDEAEGENYDQKWKKIPCEIIESTSEKFYHQIQLTAHIVPPKPWDPYARAKYLHYLKNEPSSELDFDEILETCGGKTRKRAIENEIDAYEHMEKWKNSDDYGMYYDPLKFQYFFQYQSRKTRFESIGINEDQFIKFIADDKLDQARHVTRLPEIWRNPEHDPEGEVKDTFLKDGSSEAIILLDEKKRQNRPTVDNDILQLCEKLVDEIDKFQNYDDRRAFAARLDSIDNLDNAKTALENFIVEIEDIQKEL